MLTFCGGARRFFQADVFFYIFTGIRSLEHHSVSGGASVQRLSELVTEKMVKYIQQEGLIILTIQSQVKVRLRRNTHALQTYIAGVD